MVAADANLKITAERIVWGTSTPGDLRGAGCVLVDRALHDALIEAMAATITRFFGADPKQSPDFARIVNGKHVEWLGTI